MSQAKLTNTTGAPGDDPGHQLSGLAGQEAARLQSIEALQRMRREASAEITRLIAFLDASDRYVMTELEDEHDGCEPDEGSEPSLGSFDRMTDQEKSWRQVGWFGAECDRERDTADDEPSLGSPERHCSAIGWPDGPNPTGDQTDWACGGTRDLELDPAESGIGDMDALTLIEEGAKHRD